MKSGTFLDALVLALKKCGEYNKNTELAPVSILWPDKEKEWEPLLPQLKKALPELLVLGSYVVSERTGPAIWIRCMVDRTLPEVKWPEELMPIVYLPGVSRQELRAVEDCRMQLKPLAELQYRGEFWSQYNTKDWTVFAFLKTAMRRLGLDISQDTATKQALKRALSVLVGTPVAMLQGRRLEASDFNALLTEDPIRDILVWLNDSDVVRKAWDEDRWSAFRSVCRKNYKFDPQTEGVYVAAQKLGERKDKWDKVWMRYKEAPEGYPNILEQLKQATPDDLFIGGETWPRVNEKAEDDLRHVLQELVNRPSHESRETIFELEREHGKRRDWVWAKLNKAPLAAALEHLLQIAEVISGTRSSNSLDAILKKYLEWGYKADLAVLAALDCIRHEKDANAVRNAIRSVYTSWLEDSAIRFQELVLKIGYLPSAERRVFSSGTCVLFADGLRIDLGIKLKDMLEERGLNVQLDSYWSGLPTVTATCKPLVSPVAHLIKGRIGDKDFLPSVIQTEKPLSTHYFKKILKEEGWQCLDKDELREPEGLAWTEYGSLDRYGHDQGWKISWRINEELHGLIERIESLFDSGWELIQVLTDHGWLLLPGGLPKGEVSKYLVLSRWGRCAQLKETSKYQGIMLPWHWNEEVLLALPSGIDNFVANSEYSHGGLSLQECLLPSLKIERPEPDVESTLESPIWRGLRCRVSVMNPKPGLIVDLRTKPADPSSSVTVSDKELDDSGKASLVVEDSDKEGMAASLVLLNKEGKILARKLTTIGGKE